MRLLRFGILLLMVCLALNGKAQTSIDFQVCTGTMARYTVTPSIPESHMEWILPFGGEIKATHGIQRDTVDILWSNSTGFPRLGVVEISDYGCYGDTSYVFVQVVGTPFELGFDRDVCEGNVDSLKVDDPELFKTFMWSTGETTSSIGVSSPGVYTLRVTDENDCPNIDSVKYTFLPRPMFSLGPDTMICGDQILTLDVSDDNDQRLDVYYEWNVGDNVTGSINNIAVGADTVTVSVTNLYDGNLTCTVSDTLLITECQEITNVPNTFTPNGDGKNDYWEIPYLKYFSDCSVEVFDRWGRTVFQSNGYSDNQRWDGKVRGKPVPMDTYFYVIKIGGKQGTKVGNITIIK